VPSAQNPLVELCFSHRPQNWLLASSVVGSCHLQGPTGDDLPGLLAREQRQVSVRPARGKDGCEFDRRYG
jgi:hypothetical protein